MLHKNIIPAERHAIHRWLVADPAALAALTPVTADVGKIAIQIAPFEVYILKEEIGPTWVPLANLPGGSVSIIDAGGYYTAANVEDVLQEIGAQLALVRGADVWAVAFSDETTNIVIGADKVKFHAPFNADILEVFVGLSTAQPSGAIFTVDANKNGATILSTKITVDNTETSSLTAGTPPVLSSTTVVKGDIISVGVDQVGDPGARGGKFYMRVRRTA